MRQAEKKAIKEWQSEVSEALGRLADLLENLQSIREEHESWMEDRDFETDYKFSETATGERAQEDLEKLEDWENSYQDALDSFSSILDEVDEL